MSQDPSENVSDEPAEGGQPLTLEEQAEQDELRRLAERRYWSVSRSLSAGLLFALPLLLIYEIGVLTDVSAAAAWVKTPISWLRRHPLELLGTNTTTLLNAVAIAAVLMAAWRLARRGALHAGTFLGMLIESGVYAVLIGPIALLPLTGRWQLAGFAPTPGPLWPKIVVSCGAGIYEEFIFRFVLLGTIAFLAKELGGLKNVTAGIAALFVSGVIFSLAHFLGGAESPDYGAFLFRLFAGMVFGVIYLARGFGVAAWTHALYDIYVLGFVGS